MTNKIVLRTTEEFMADYAPTYQPMYPLLMGKSQSYAEEVGDVSFKRATTVGDIRAAHLTPKDTGFKQVAVGEGKKTFKKYFLANQYIQSNLQDTQGNEDVIAQVLDEHQKQADELSIFGDGPSQGTQLNNGLIFSSDANHVTKSSSAIADLAALHAAVMGTVVEANQISGRKLVLHYGSTVSTKINGLYSTTVPTPFRRILVDSLPAGSNVVEIPTEVAPTGNGYVVVNLDQVKLHYLMLPQLKNQGVNEEKLYTWHNFLMGSMMIEVLAKKGVIHQPLTFS